MSSFLMAHQLSLWLQKKEHCLYSEFLTVYASTAHFLCRSFHCTFTMCLILYICWFTVTNAKQWLQIRTVQVKWQKVITTCDKANDGIRFKGLHYSLLQICNIPILGCKYELLEVQYTKMWMLTRKRWSRLFIYRKQPNKGYFIREPEN